MKAELRAAHKAQMSIMPQLNPQIEGFDISGVCLPASEVGGDFFEYIWLDEAKTKFAVAVGDVSGKAMSAAMMAVMASGMVNSEAYKNKSIKEIFNHLNRSLYSKTDKTTFVALYLASLDIRTKELTFINAGLNEPLLKSNGNVDYLQSAEPKYPLGGIENVSYQEKKTHLKSGDVLILFSDGIPDAQNSAKEFFGHTALKNILLNMNTSISAQDIVREITRHIKQFTGAMPQFDDITLVVIKIAV
jgi:serine phosphatase RsbU (regulator of sigma subunit)